MDICERLFQIIAQTLCIHIQEGRILPDQCIAQDDGETRDIIPAHVEQPGDVIHPGDDVDVSSRFFHFFAHFCQLVRCALAGVFLRKFKGPAGRQGRTIFPDRTHQIHITLEGDCLVLQLIL